jgi:ABC-type multidrug transport system fused ATPase/permease subunit
LGNWQLEDSAVKSLKFVFKYTHKYVAPLALTVVSMLLLVGVQLLAPWIVKTMVATMTDPTARPEAAGFITRLALLSLAVYVGHAGLQFLRPAD